MTRLPSITPRVPTRRELADTPPAVLVALLRLAGAVEHHAPTPHWMQAYAADVAAAVSAHMRGHAHEPVEA
ncbi:MAG TPA: hypothetical protein VIL25_09395 [Vicinamibacterales bacterium]